MDQPSAVQQHCPLYSILAPLSFKCTLRQIWPWPTFYCILSKADTVLLSIISLVLTLSELCGNSSQSRLLSVFFLMPLLSHWTMFKSSNELTFNLFCLHTNSETCVSYFETGKKKNLKRKKGFLHFSEDLAGWSKVDLNVVLQLQYQLVKVSLLLTVFPPLK